MINPRCLVLINCACAGSLTDNLLYYSCCKHLQNHFQGGHQWIHFEQDMLNGALQKFFWNLANHCSWAGWCVTKQTRRAVISVRLWAKFNFCTVPPSFLFHCSWLIKNRCNMSKRNAQHHAQINKPGCLMQDTWAKPVPLLTIRKASTVFIFCCCFKTATSHETNGKKYHGICLLWMQFNSKPQRWLHNQLLIRADQVQG